MCTDCECAAKYPHYGAYDCECLQCCARFVMAARPWLAKQEQALEFISRHKGAPSRERVLECIKEMT